MIKDKKYIFAILPIVAAGVLMLTSLGHIFAAIPPDPQPPPSPDKSTSNPLSGITAEDINSCEGDLESIECQAVISACLQYPTECAAIKATATGQPSGSQTGTSTASSKPCPKKTFFFLPPWWEYLGSETDPLGKCAPAFNFPNDIWKVALAILDMLLRIAGFIAVLSIIFSGVMYITAQGNVEKATSARRRVYNSLIGLAIALVATAFVTFLGNTLAP